MLNHNQKVLPKNSFIGIPGGGQLATFLTWGAHEHGYRVVLLVKSENEPAVKYADEVIVDPHQTLEKFQQMARIASVIALETENTNAEFHRIAGRDALLRPSSLVLEATQSRIAETKLLRKLGLPKVKTCFLRKRPDPQHWLEFPYPGIVKVGQTGYDGKGQVHALEAMQLPEAWDAAGKGAPCTLEQRIDLRCEFSIFVAKDLYGHVELSPPIQNWHENGILAKSQFPGPDLTPTMVEHGIKIARTYGSWLAPGDVSMIEYFADENEFVYVNEIAPRIHNSGHGTMDAWTISQVGQEIRAITGHPVEPMRPHHGFIMENFIGISEEEAAARVRPGGKHINYGKGEVLDGRKMGHVTYLTPLAA